MLPDFIIVGAMKSGTSTLQAQLAAQDGVFMCIPKEPNYFSDDAVFAKGQDWYESLFAEAASGDLIGEASTHYTKLPTYPQTLPRMRTVLTAPRLIYMIRNPVDRAISHYIHAWSMGEAGHDATAAFAAMPELVDYGCYGRQIAPFVAAYGAERIHLTSLEAFKANPDAAFSAVVAFLDLPRGAAWQHDMAAQNVSAERARPIPFQHLLIDNPVARTLRRTLVPKALRTRIRQTRTMGSRPDIPDDLHARLQDAFLTDRAELATHFPGHPALDACYSFSRP